MTRQFYDLARPLDALKEEKHPTETQTKEVLDALRNKSLRRYFFYELNNPAWVVPLKEKGVFLSPPEPIKLEKDMVRYPVWEAGVYLARVAQHCPKEIVRIISKLSHTENISAQVALVDAMLKIPIAHAIKVIPVLTQWLKQGYQFYMYHRMGEFVVKLAKEEKWKDATELFLVLLELSKEQYEIQETLKELVKNAEGAQIFKTLEFLEQSIDKAIIKSKEDKHSYIWRPSIEDHQQNIGAFGTKDLLISSTRDLLKKCIDGDTAKTKKKLKTYLRSKHEIYWRFAINAITQYPNIFKDLIYSTLKNEKYLFEDEVHHEYFELIKTGFPLLTNDEQKIFTALIKRGPKEEINEDYKQCWVRDRLTIIEEHLDTETRRELNDIIDSYEKPEHPEFRSYMRSWVGPESPESQEALRERTPENLLNYLLTWKPPEERFAPSPEGLARDLETIVAENPEGYAKKAECFLDNDMRPVYCFHFLWGLRAAIGKGKGFSWEPVLTFCEKVIVKPDKLAEEQKEEDYNDVRCAVADLLQDAVSRKESALPRELMLRARDILLSSKLLNNPEPTLEYENKYKPLDSSINTVRALTMHSLVKYAHARATLIRKAKEENDVETLDMLHAQDGNLEQVVKDAFEKKLNRNIEKTLTIHSTYGRYFPLLHYIDKEWATKLVPRIFPTAANENKYWEIAWKAYVLFNPLYNQMYELLKEHYAKAVQGLKAKEVKESDEESRRLAGHFMTVYWRELEPLEDNKSLLNAFLLNASDTLRGHCVWTLRSVLKEIDKEAADWKRLRKYWENRLAAANSAENPDEYQHEIASFTLWFKDLPEELYNISELVEQTTKYVKDSTDIRNLVDYISSKSNEYPLETAKILDTLVNETTPMNLQSETTPIKMILTDCIVCGGESENIARSIVHRFGELGIFEFKNLLEIQPTCQ